MAEELQKIAWDTSRALCEAGAVIREPVLNTGDDDNFGPELIVPDDTGTIFHRFPSRQVLLTTDTGFSGLSLLGVDDSALVNISGSTGQAIVESIDTALNDTASSSSTLSDVSDNSLTTADQTFNNKSAQSILFKDSVGSDLVTLSDSGVSIDSQSNALNLDGTGINITSDAGVSVQAISGAIELEGSVVIDSSVADSPPLTLTPMTTPSIDVDDGSMWVESAGAYIRVNGVTTRFDRAGTLAEVSDQSTTSLSQTFTAKPATNISIIDANVSTGLFMRPTETELTALTDLFLGSNGSSYLSAQSTIIFNVPSLGTIQFSGNVYFENSTIHITGNATTDGSWRLVEVGSDLEFQRRETGTWITKLSIPA